MTGFAGVEISSVSLGRGQSYIDQTPLNHRLPHVLYLRQAMTAEVERWLRQRFGPPSYETWGYVDCRTRHDPEDAPEHGYSFKTVDQAFEMRMRWS